jgi:hypothetical protein
MGLYGYLCCGAMYAFSLFMANKDGGVGSILKGVHLRESGSMPSTVMEFETPSP